MLRVMVLVLVLVMGVLAIHASVVARSVSFGPIHNEKYAARTKPLGQTLDGHVNVVDVVQGHAYSHQVEVAQLLSVQWGLGCLHKGSQEVSLDGHYLRLGEANINSCSTILVQHALRNIDTDTLREQAME